MLDGMVIRVGGLISHCSGSFRSGLAGPEHRL